jgi:Icc-related predicted phosphoesterase
MKRYGWLTDIHLNFLQMPDCEAFLASLRGDNLDGVLIGGDIAEGHTLETYLKMIDREIACPVYFVLGNHDFYNSSFAEVHATVRSVCRARQRLHYLTDEMLIALSPSTALIGHDGWADGRLGQFFGTQVMMTDHLEIEDLAILDPEERLVKVRELGDAVAQYVRTQLPPALEQYDRVILLTHVPPFPEACHRGADFPREEILPHYCSQIVGEVLRDIMSRHSRNTLTVLCGHTHGRREVQIADNLVVKTGGATYGAPRLQEVLTI